MDGKTFAKALALATRTATPRDSILGSEMAAHMETPLDVTRELFEAAMADAEWALTKAQLAYLLEEIRGACEVTERALDSAGPADLARLEDVLATLKRAQAGAAAHAARIAAARLRLAIHRAQLRAKLGSPDELVSTGIDFTALSEAAASAGEAAAGFASDVVREGAGQIKTLEDLFDKMVAS